jgi:putative addiction module component (TIGR02574 family)
MSQPTVDLNIAELDRGQRIELLAKVWDSLLESGGLPPLPEWHLNEVGRRVARADAEPGTAIPLEQLRAEFLGKKP